jgi:ATP-binding cassette subfamily B protein
MSRLFEIMDAQPEVAEKEDPIYPENLSGKVEFDHVSFSYQKGKKTIQDINFCVEDGQILGIVGHTGAGKSTIANLLMRLYDVEEGEIRVGGYPVRDLALSSLYNHIAIVSQETYLFMGSILDNIRYANPEASFEEVIEAAKCAGAHEFIMKMPDAYHTQIGFGYQDLSGGERQRISIARAILKNPKILILDEATVAMDTGTERKIQEALSMLIKGKTTIMIAHRLSTLRDADHLIVIEKGKVAEAGTHSELLAREDGVYKKLFNLQLEALKNAGISE